MPIAPGLTGRLEAKVEPDDTAIAFRSGAVPVLATPRVLALCEEASCRAVADTLQNGETTVGFRVQLDHVSPVRVGTTVRVESTLEKVQGRRLTFAVSVSDDVGLVAAGKVTRVLVDNAEFMQKAR